MAVEEIENWNILKTASCGVNKLYLAEKHSVRHPKISKTDVYVYLKKIGRLKVEIWTVRFGTLNYVDACCK